MPIEIRELVIKTNIVQQPTVTTQQKTNEMLAMKKEILAQCKKMVKTAMLKSKDKR